MKDKLEGIILSLSPYGETGTLAQVLTKEAGYLSFVAKGSAKLSAKNRLMPLCRCRFLFDYKEGKTIFTLQQKELLKSYYSSDLKELSFKNVLTEMVSRLRPEETADVYEDLLFVLENYDKQKEALLGCFLTSRLLHYACIAPYTDGCVVCGKSTVQGFSVQKGGFLCAEHVTEAERCDLPELRRIRYLEIAGKEKVLRIPEDYTLEDWDRYIDFLKRHADTRLRSYDFYRQL